MTGKISENDNQKPRERWSHSLRLVFREYAESLFIAVGLALILRFFVVSTYHIPSASMVPSLKPGDLLLAYKLPYGLAIPFSSKKLGGAHPERGDVVVFRCPYQTSKSCIKRVVALPGDRVEIKQHRLFINERPAKYSSPDKAILADLPQYHKGYVPLRESLAGDERLVLISGSKEAATFGPVVVPPGRFFVLADNRGEGEDSRKWGTVPMELLEARVLTVWLSLSWGRSGASEAWPSFRWERVFKRVD